MSYIRDHLKFIFVLCVFGLFFSSCKKGGSAQLTVNLKPADIRFDQFLGSSGVRIQIEKTDAQNQIVIEDMTLDIGDDFLTINANLPFEMSAPPPGEPPWKGVNTYTFSVSFDFFKYDGAVREAVLSIPITSTMFGSETITIPVFLPEPRLEKQLTQGRDTSLRSIPVGFFQEGTQILYSMGRRIEGREDLAFDIFSIETEGANKQQITNLLGHNIAVDVSEDGSIILFSNESSDGSINIYTHSNGQSTQITNNGFQNIPVALSPTGNQVLFHSNRNGNYDVFVAEINTLTVSQVSDDSDDDFAVDWASNGTNQILYYNLDPLRGEEIFFADPSGNPRPAAINSIEDDRPVAFHPSADEILFYSERNGRRDMYTYSPSTGILFNLTQDFPQFETTFEFPTGYVNNGGDILFHSIVFGDNADIFLISTSGTNLRQVTGFITSEFPVDYDANSRKTLYYSERRFRTQHMFTIQIPETVNQTPTP